MSRFGEIVDSIIEMLENKEELDVGVIRKKLLLTDTTILIFMNEYGIIELEGCTAKITEPGLELLNDCSCS